MRDRQHWYTWLKKRGPCLTLRRLPHIRHPSIDNTITRTWTPDMWRNEVGKGGINESTFAAFRQTASCLTTYQKPTSAQCIHSSCRSCTSLSHPKPLQRDNKYLVYIVSPPQGTGNMYSRSRCPLIRYFHLWLPHFLLPDSSSWPPLSWRIKKKLLQRNLSTLLIAHLLRGSKFLQDTVSLAQGTANM